MHPYLCDRCKGWKKIMMSGETLYWKKSHKIIERTCGFCKGTGRKRFKDLTKEKQIEIMRYNKYATAQEAEKHWDDKEGGDDSNKD